MIYSQKEKGRAQKTLQESYDEAVEQIMEDHNVNRFKAKRILKYKLMKGDIE